MKDSAHNKGSLNGTINSTPRSPRQTAIISDETIPLRRAKGVDPSCRALLSMMIKFNIYRHKNGSWIRGWALQTMLRMSHSPKLKRLKSFNLRFSPSIKSEYLLHVLCSILREKGH